MKNAFTLAEVLITLGIIGVVAAMTIPTLISNTNGAQFKTAYKKALSTMNQAVLMNVALEDTDFSTLKDGSQLASGNHKAGTLGAMLQDRLQSATDVTSNYFTEVQKNSGALPTATLKVTVSCTAQDKEDATDATAGTAEALCASANIQPGETSADVTGNITFAPTTDTYYVFALADGTYFGFNKNAQNCTKGNMDCIGFIDVNGATNPNTIVKCDDDTAATCEVQAANIKDIYPVIFYEQTVEPASDAARTVLFGK